jgi:hypothetical protein
MQSIAYIVPAITVTTRNEPRRFRRAPYIRAIQRGLEFDLLEQAKIALRCLAGGELLPKSYCIRRLYVMDTRARDLLIVRAADE